MPRLEQWSLVGPTGLPSARLEPHAQSLRGAVYGHPRHKDGNQVRTSDIAAVAAGTVTTTTGQVYQLGAPDPAYLVWLGGRPLPLVPHVVTPTPLPHAGRARP